MNKIGPTSQAFLGTWIRCADFYNRDEEISFMRHIYETSKKKHSHQEKNSWCEFEEPQLIERPPLSGDIFLSYGTVGFKWRVEGRSFFIKRNFPSPKEHRTHSNKKNVPKCKRGKRIFLNKPKHRNDQEKSQSHPPKGQQVGH
ncbi:hypothetical protein HC928_02460 [bacterium]|nr:hypothetical protein [bacterium]